MLPQASSATAAVDAPALRQVEAPPVHQHIHLHGVSPAHVAAIVAAQQQLAA